MKIALLSDIHFPTLSQQKHNVFQYKNTIENNFHVNRLMLLAEEVNKLNVDRVFILGDLLDTTNINLCTQRVLKDFVNSVTATIYYLNGNHERIDQNNYILDYLDIGMRPLPKEFELYDTTFTALNHNQIHEATSHKSDILLSHFRWTLPTFWGTKGELSKGDLVKVTNNYSDIILGDIHAEYQPEDNVTYINQPYSTKYLPVTPKGLLILELGDGYEIIRHHLSLPNKVLIDVKFEDLVATLKTLHNRNLYKLRVHLKDTYIGDLPQIPSNVKLELKVINNDVKEEQIVVNQDNLLDTILSVLPNENKAYIKGLLC